jgi:hypothetical protein
MIAETAIASAAVASAATTTATATTPPAAAIATAATTTASAAPTSAAAITTAPSTTAAAAFRAWARFVHSEVAAIETVTVQTFSRGVRFFFRGHRHKSKPARTTAHAIEHQVDIGDGSVLGEKILQIVFCDVVGKISYEQLGIHSFTVILEITPAKRAPSLGVHQISTRILTTFVRSRI